MRRAPIQTTLVLPAAGYSQAPAAAKMEDLLSHSAATLFTVARVVITLMNIPQAREKLVMKIRAAIVQNLVRFATVFLMIALAEN